MRRQYMAAFASLIVLLLCGLSATAAGARENGMLDWPREEMRGALDYLIERRMEELGVPGVAIAIVADGEIVLEKGYGVADTDGDQPVTENTLFEAGGIGLPIEAYAALLLAKEKKLSLDAPLSQSLATPWLPDREASRKITLRHVLTHRSGLSDRVRLGSRSIGFEPGSEFSYSGMGYVYLAHVMSEVEGVSFDRLMRQRVFQPLGMSSSGYIIPEALVNEVARGHHALWVPILAFAGPMVAIFIVLAIATILVVRLGFHRLRLEPFDLVPAAAVAPIGAGLFVYYLQGGWALLFCLGYFLVWIVGVAVLAALLQYLRFIFDKGRHDGVISRGSHRAPLSPFSFGVVFLASLLFMTWQVPLPARDGHDFNAALSLRSSAHDLGLFVSAFIDGGLIGPSARARIVDERIEIGGDGRDVYGWGLGFGTRERPDGLTIWHSTANIGLRGLMVIDPARRSGVVVLTNADSGKVLMHEVAGHVLGPETPWQLP
ncbi:serine hydrolase domain-containing protein [Parvibaculum sp.]|uniref:serine hydrolase domain-containing protein n=1 Tax=Parvibaculum sp. TaxID=2024848 RepID=UPI001B2BA4CC|nr:serine hydrolase domain-containing protein [Parvibaculum sp.]MBO6677331.1 beta-lactamase family protein [Parvibaculum sp.]MBO6686015.1 beta-lactamase family protein [Parvibaculum sp.]MBO6906345.1 beta-lactamase family protein [Parvibaculum sp.]